MDQTPIVSLAGGHPLIDIDLTVVVQFVLFLVLFAVANRLLFQPYLQLRERRKAGIEDLRALGELAQELSNLLLWRQLRRQAGE